MDKMAQQNDALVEETNAAIKQTEGQTVELDKIVDFYQIHANAEYRKTPALQRNSLPQDLNLSRVRLSQICNNILPILCFWALKPGHQYSFIIVTN